MDLIAEISYYSFNPYSNQELQTKVEVNACRKVIKGCIQMNSIAKRSRFMRKQN